jgi:hypothetical protein
VYPDQLDLHERIMTPTFYLLPLLLACTDGTKAEDPPEVFVQVVVGAYSGCALTDRHRVACWDPGSPTVDFGQADPPDEEFSLLSAGPAQTCGLTLTGDVACWGVSDGEELDNGQTVNEPGPFTKVSTGAFETCVIGLVDDLHCWTRDVSAYTDVPNPDAPTADVSLNRGGCVLDPSGELSCWGDPEGGGGALDAPAGAFVSVATGALHACALDATGAATCWGTVWADGYTPWAPAPDGAHFLQIAAGYSVTCGVTDTSAALCWVDYDAYYPEGIVDHEPPGRYTNISVGVDLACAVRDDGAVVCWGISVNEPFPTADAPLFASDSG